MTLIEDLVSRLQWEEGFSPDAYVDTTGNVTVLFGLNLGKLILPSDANFRPQDIRIAPVHHFTRADGDVYLRRKIEEVIAAVSVLPLWSGLNYARRLVIADMAYNLGPGFVTKGSSKAWPKFIGQLENWDWEAAAQNMRSTPWYTQVHPRRADPLILMMRTGA